MGARPNPEAEVDVRAELVKALLADQHPDLADRRLAVAAEGWDNVVYRLGDDLAVRLPRRQLGAPLIEHEQRWLPELAPRLPLPVPAPVRVGRPALGYPWAWSVTPWFAGDIAGRTPPVDRDAAADQLGAFVAAMHQPAPPDAPPSTVRGCPLADRHDMHVERLARIDGMVDGAAVSEAWAAALAEPGWDGPALWLHGDLHPANLLVEDGRLSAVIDFGDLTAGDPATDLAVAWMMFPPSARDRFRAAVGVDDATWRRGKGWAVSIGLACLAESADNEMFTAIGHTTLAAVLADDP